jgi:hypothetical protein
MIARLERVSSPYPMGLWCRPAGFANHGVALSSGDRDDSYDFRVIYGFVTLWVAQSGHGNHFKGGTTTPNRWFLLKHDPAIHWP